MNRTSFLPVLALLALSIGGCTTNVPTNDEPSSRKDAGVALFTVTITKPHSILAGARIYFYFNGGEMPSASRVMVSSSGDFGGGADWPFADAWGQVFAIEFPAGQNQLNLWSLRTGAGFTYSDRKLPPLTFEVKSGSVIYIGNLHGKIQYAKSMAGLTVAGGVTPEIRDEHERDLPIVFKRYPQYQGRVEITPLKVGPWLPQ